jgi:HlyD family secretion protein
VSGRIEGDESNVSPRLSGRVAEVLVREGQEVRSGDLMVRLSGEQTVATRAEAQARAEAAQRRVEQARQEVQVLESRLRQVDIQERQARVDSEGRVAQAEGQLAAAQAELARAEAELGQTKSDAGRYSELAGKGAIPRQQAEQYQTRVKTSEALVEAARKQVGAAEGALKIARAATENPEIRQAERDSLQRQINEARARVRLYQSEVAAAQAVLARTSADVEDLTVMAPFDGVVVTRAAEPGEVVSPGTTLLTLVDPNQLYLRAYVPEGDIGHVTTGQNAEVFLDSAPEEAIPARVMRIDPEAMFTPENTYFQQDRVKQVVGVKLLLLGGQGKAKLGMPADGRILIESGQEDR